VSIELSSGGEKKGRERERGKKGGGAKAVYILVDNDNERENETLLVTFIESQVSWASKQAQDP
jgi:hypothetical protein